MLIKRKVPTCVTVKYQTQTERWKGRKVQNPKFKVKKEEIKQESNENANAEEKDTKLEECEETKSERHSETQSESEKKNEDEKGEKTEGESHFD
ncbi:hypothetical protein EAI_11025 [Harpegnathos saltator]|uniref:Uncharacterized protein n=2 Tax=Harpegnathos saltator TaxID=610380 RepID=E2BWV5_HARSA|nr:hypothetical protein EAI_11025 [Harpegnathos saltator]